MSPALVGRFFTISATLSLFAQSLGHVQLFRPPRTAAWKAYLSFIIPRSLLKLMSITSVMSSNHLILCHSLLLLLSVFPNMRDFCNELALPIRWPKYWSFSFLISLSNEYSGLISFSIDWFDLFAQGTLKNLPSTTIQKYQFFSAQPSLRSNSHICT